MTDTLPESARAVIVLGLLVYLWRAGSQKSHTDQRGWSYILGGLFLLLLGSIFDITDNFESLDRFVIIGDTETEAFIENVVGFLGGFVLLAIGLVRWAPSVQRFAAESAERQQMEKALAAKSALSETTFESMSQGFAVYDSDLKLVAFNRRFVKMMDYPPDLIQVGIGLEDIFRFRAERGDFGPGTDIDELVRKRIEARRGGG